MYIPQIIIESIVDTIINTRDFCGDEFEAAIDAAHEAGLKGDDLKKAVRIASFRANARWNQYKKAAGVNQKYRF